MYSQVVEHEEGHGQNTVWGRETTAGWVRVIITDGSDPAEAENTKVAEDEQQACDDSS